MAVFRVERIKDYTVMSNHHLRNKNLSLKAKGLLSQKPPPQLLPQKPHLAIPLQAGFPAW